MREARDTSRRETLLQAIRDRNAAYRTCRSVTEENHELAQEVDRLRAVLHRLEQANLEQASQQDVAHSTSNVLDAGEALRNDALRISPLLWPRLAYGVVQRLSSSDPADFCSAVEAVCAGAKDRLVEDLAVNAATGCGATPPVESPSAHAVMPPSDPSGAPGSGPIPCHDQKNPFASADTGVATPGKAISMTLQDVVSQFATHIVRHMLESSGRVDLGQLRAHEESFRRLLLEACCQSASSKLDVSKDLADKDRKKAAGMPSGMRTLMSEELLETHEKLAEAEQAVFSSQAELLEAYRKLSASGKEVAALRKELVAVQGELLRAQKELSEEVAFFRQVREENRVQAAIIKNHGPLLQQLNAEQGALLEERAALRRKVRFRFRFEFRFRFRFRFLRSSQPCDARCTT